MKPALAAACPARTMSSRSVRALLRCRPSEGGRARRIAAGPVHFFGRCARSTRDRHFPYVNGELAATVDGEWDEHDVMAVRARQVPALRRLGVATSSVPARASNPEAGGRSGQCGRPPRRRWRHTRVSVGLHHRVDEARIGQSCVSGMRTSRSDISDVTRIWQVRRLLAHRFSATPSRIMSSSSSTGGSA